jgi:hypothetical protein
VLEKDKNWSAGKKQELECWKKTRTGVLEKNEDWSVGKGQELENWSDGVS